MPTTEHDVLARMFRQRPGLAPQLLSLLFNIPVPAGTEARRETIDFTNLTPAPYLADAVSSLVVRRKVVRPPRGPRRRGRRRGRLREPVDPAIRAYVTEVQRGIDRRKRRSIPVYATTLHATLDCPVTVIIVATTEKVARWAAKPMVFGDPPGAVQAVVIGPRDVPPVTDLDLARHCPELAVLSARVHGNGPEGTAVLRVLYAALNELDPDDAQLYYEAVADGLAPAALKILKESTMTSAAIIPNDPRAVNLRRLMEGAAVEGEARGEARGEAAGLVEGVLAVLAACGIEVSKDAHDRIAACADLGQLRGWLTRAAKITSVQELFD